MAIFEDFWNEWTKVPFFFAKGLTRTCGINMSHEPHDPDLQITGVNLFVEILIFAPNRKCIVKLDFYQFPTKLFGHIELGS